MGLYKQASWISGVAMMIASSPAFATSNVTSIDFKADGAASRIEIKSNGPIEIEKQENAEDRQIVVDLKNAKLTKYATRKLDTSSFDSPVSLISPYQLPKSSATAPDTARVVIQLRQMTSADVAQDGNTIRISLGAAPEDPPAPSESSGDLSPAAENTTDMPSPPESSSSASTAAASAAPAAPKSPLELALEARETRRFIGRPITLQLRDADLTDVFRLIGEASGFNIVLGEGVSGKITLSLIEVPWDQALDTILQNSSLGAERNNNVLRVTTLANLTKEKEAQLRAKQATEATSPRVTRIFPISFAKLADLQSIITKFASQSTSTSAESSTVVQSDNRTNSLIVRDTPENIERIRKLIETLDTQTPQILIEAKVIEASENFSRSFGGSIGLITATSPRLAGSANLLSTAVPNGTDFLGSENGASFGIVPGNQRVLATLSVAESEGNVKILSSPKAVVLDRETATISAGEPILVEASTTIGTTTTRTFITQTADLSLNVEPQVTNEGSVLMNITVNRGVIKNLGSDQKAIAPRTIKTKVLVESGSTLVMGGVYTLDTLKGSSGFPFLRKLPILGWFFGKDSENTVKSELMFFITPRILNPKEAGLQNS